MDNIDGMEELRDWRKQSTVINLEVRAIRAVFAPLPGGAEDGTLSLAHLVRV